MRRLLLLSLTAFWFAAAMTSAYKYGRRIELTVWQNAVYGKDVNPHTILLARIREKVREFPLANVPNSVQARIGSNESPSSRTELRTLNVSAAVGLCLFLTATCVVKAFRKKMHRPLNLDKVGENCNESESRA
jgi:hypothetical protein